MGGEEIMTLLKRGAVVVAVAVLGAGIALAQAGAAPKGADIFKAKCAMCHGADGKGQTPMGKTFKIKDLGSSEVQSAKDAELKTIIEDGKRPMPAYKGKLTGEQVGEVVAYIRSLKK